MSLADGGSDLMGGEPEGEVILKPDEKQKIAASRRFQQTQAQVDEVVGIMKDNVERVLERDAKLTELDDRADALQQGASQFEQQAGRLKRKQWWKNVKMLLVIGFICIVMFLIFKELLS